MKIFSQSKKMLSIILVVLICSVWVFPVFAYLKYDHGYVSSKIPIEDRTSYSELHSAIKSWNDCGANVNIYTVAGSGKSWITDEVIDDVWNGEYKPINLQYVFWGKATKFKITLNRTALVSESSNYKKSVIVHELGHALSLDDNPPEKTSIMRYDRNREKITTPQADDIKGVKAIY